MKHDKMYLDIASRYAEESYCTRRKVGCCVVTPDLVTLGGYNGTASGQANVCELEDGTTNPEVLHAEANALMKALRSGVSTKDATLYCTLSPCLECSKLIYQSGIKRVVYINKYRNTSGVDFLERLGVEVQEGYV